MKKNRKIDPIKAFLFIIFIAAATTIIIFTTFIPDIKKLKIAHMTRDKMLITLEQSKLENETKQKNLAKILIENEKAISSLGNRFLTDKFHKEINSYFSQVELNQKEIVETDEFVTKIYSVKAELKDPNRFYEFIDSLTKSNFAVGIDFPIDIKADEEFNLKLEFTIKAHNTK